MLRKGSTARPVRWRKTVELWVCVEHSSRIMRLLHKQSQIKLGYVARLHAGHTISELTQAGEDVIS